MVDTMTNPMDTMVMDTTVMDTTIMVEPCDSTKIYFEDDVLPILLSNCGFSGCHDAGTATAGVILTDYDNVINTADVEAFDLNGSKLYRVITDDDPNEVMPPGGKMSNDKLNIIAQWILQGADNLMCEDEPLNCIEGEVSYADDIIPLMNTYCNGCHSTSNAFGGVITDTYANMKTIADNGRLFGALNWDEGYVAMPQGQDQLDSCKIVIVKNWIDEGAKDN